MLGGNIERIKSLDMDASVKLEVFENIYEDKLRLAAEKLKSAETLKSVELRLAAEKLKSARENLQRAKADVVTRDITIRKLKGELTPRSVMEIFEQGFGKDGKESRLSFWTAMLKKDENAHFAEKLCKAGLNLDEVPFHATQLYRRFNDKLHKVALMDFEDVKEIMIIGNFSPEQKILFTCMAKNFSLSASFKAVEGGDMLVEIVKQHDNSASH